MPQASDKTSPLIDFDTVIKQAGLFGPMLRLLAPALQAGLGINTFNGWHDEIVEILDDPEDDPAFFMKALKVIGCSFEVDAELFERIPKSGPLVVVSNHPYGGIDGVVLGAMLRGARTDSKLMGNYLLSHMSGIRGNIINVDPFERDGSAKANLSGMRDALRWLKQGGCLGVFPAGEVSSLDLSIRSVVDRPWSNHIVPLAQRTQATILPVFFEGRNSALFQALGLIHPRLRTALLIREFCRLQNTTFQVRIGKPIEASHLERFKTKEAATEYLRLKCYALQSSEAESPLRKKLKLPFRSATVSKSLKPLAEPQAASVLLDEIEQLPEERLLVDHGDFQIFCASASEVPLTLLEIGRLREETFRAVEEGTGSSRDLDEFDDYYLHLFMWSKKDREIVGAYRIGLVDQIVDKYGKQGLYTATLFKFRSGFLDKMGPAIELGRSFICLKYQKKHASLALIWRGIGEFIVRHPNYCTLFGPVSITDAYHHVSKDLMVHYFREHSFDEEMSRFVRAKKPPKAKKQLGGICLKSMGEALNSVSAISAVVSGFEDDDKGIPILLRHYLKLNGCLLSFNVDPAFSDVIDGLILVDLRKTDPKILQRYMGKEGYESFKEYHYEAPVVV
ncbi:lysophospholipid acyltransferase family protein [Coraliomargarita akajimensis]|uniref:Phospholipid/glycerol acyltransferase n=1 Tax=Coraliomargarita akajimensis (strain DSM 45221 / IAM 15411 / JCM 23193 / KCTC 12865 / 04OKA010-24) TaxID=583355 RepID=D5EHW4_CORAD|nr:lysophospholipid acyltransferase family protein [Coraliomargarita akajimensis]ADE54155.1 phospholipid/glycerol acyltransferase [Coraliomargarita akajimensis DSM 45221]